MKKMKYIMILLFSLMLIQPVYADDGDVTISFSLTPEDTFTYEVEAKGNGELFGYGEKIRNKNVKFDLQVEETKTFIVKADDGYQVKEITANGEALDTTMNRITIHGVSIDCKVYVEFAKIPNKNDSTKNPSYAEPSESSNSAKSNRSKNNSNEDSENSDKKASNGIVSGEKLDEKDLKEEIDKAIGDDKRVPFIMVMSGVVLSIGLIFILLKKRKNQDKETSL